MSQVRDEDESHSVQRGIENVVADWTKVSFVDGEKGQLYYRGIDIAELAAHATFEECVGLLLCGNLPVASQLTALNWKLRQLSTPPDTVLRILKELPRKADPLAALQVALSTLACTDLGERLGQDESLFENALRIIAQAPVIVAAAHRHSRGLPILTPNPTLNHAENFLYMLNGQVPSRTTSRYLELAIILQMDHGFNPSTFTARAVASTLTNIYAASAAAVGSLSGPLHGGASVRAMNMINELRHSPNLSKAVCNLIDSGQRIMGMGHRLYHTKDPRALILEDLLKQQCSRKNVKKDYELLKHIEESAEQGLHSRGRNIYVNIDFWSGTFYRHLGLAETLYPAVFAVARVTGWCAHILELRQANRLYRPLSEYRGKTGLPYIPMNEREGAK